MGRVIELDTKKVAPIEKELEMSNLAIIAMNYSKEPMKMIVPVREHPYKNGWFVLLDGHHSSCIADTLNEDEPGAVGIYGWVAESRIDLIPKLSNDFHQGRIFNQNHHIRKNYDNVETCLLDPKVPSAVPELRAKYSVLSSAESLFNYTYLGF